MRKIFVSAVMTVLCAPAISATPAVGHEFYGDSPFALEAISNATQTFQLGSTDSLECSKLALTYSPALGASSKLALVVNSYGSAGKCIFNHSSVSEGAMMGTTGCEFVLGSSMLKERFANNFIDGTLGLECTIGFETTSCGGRILKNSSLSEFGWENINTVLGLYDSELFFDLGGMHYEIVGTGCGSSGTSGEYHGSIQLEGVIVK